MKRVNAVVLLGLIAGSLVACGPGVELPRHERVTRPALRVAVGSARIVVVPENRADVAIEGSAAPFEVTREGLELALTDGSAPNDGAKCRPAAAPADLPVVTIRTPLAVDIYSQGAVVGEIRAAHSLRLASGGCGAWRAAASAGPAELVQAGGGSIALGEARMGLNARLTGPGSITVGNAAGPLSVDVEGRGQFRLGDGVTQRAFLHLDGPGVIDHRGRVGTLRAELEGSGDIRVATVTGQVQRKLQGTGEVTWGRPAGRSYCGGVQCQRRRDARGER